MRFSILIPTTGERAQLVEQALWSVSRQSVQDYEVLIIGDGVAEASRELIRRKCADDSRIRFFDHPKHPSRGEEYRHAALQEATGEGVCYLCDRDLYLPWHLDRLAGGLATHDVVASLPITTLPCDRFLLKFRGTLAARGNRIRIAKTSVRGIPLSCGSHRMDAYRRLSEGWATTPTGLATDSYMWAKFFRDDRFRHASLAMPTVVYLRRGGHPGWSPERRLGEQLRWRRRMESRDFEVGYWREVSEVLARSRAEWSSRPLRRAWFEFLSERRQIAARKHGPRLLRMRLLDFLVSRAGACFDQSSETG